MKIIVAGGTGFLGKSICQKFPKNYEFIVLSRNVHQDTDNVKYVQWDGQNEGNWVNEIEGADVVINLSGKSVNCRYTEENKRKIFDSRTDSTTALGNAIKKAIHPPKLWINSSSATIYRHAEDREMDEFTGEIGNGFSVKVCKKWEKSFNEAEVEGTRKVVIRMALVLGKGGGVLPTLLGLVKKGLGGTQGNGEQYVSWIHIDDFISALLFIIRNESMNGVINLASPNPVKNRKFMDVLRRIANMPFGLRLYRFMVNIGAVFMGTESELILKSRRVVPKRLIQNGFKFKYESIDLVVGALSYK